MSTYPVPNVAVRRHVASVGPRSSAVNSLLALSWLLPRGAHSKRLGARGKPGHRDPFPGSPGYVSGPRLVRRLAGPDRLHSSQVGLKESLLGRCQKPLAGTMVTRAVRGSWRLLRFARGLCRALAGWVRDGRPSHRARSKQASRRLRAAAGAGYIMRGCWARSPLCNGQKRQRHTAPSCATTALGPKHLLRCCRAGKGMAPLRPGQILFCRAFSGTKPGIVKRSQLAALRQGVKMVKACRQPLPIDKARWAAGGELPSPVALLISDPSPNSRGTPAATQWVKTAALNRALPQGACSEGELIHVKHTHTSHKTQGMRWTPAIHGGGES